MKTASTPENSLTTKVAKKMAMLVHASCCNHGTPMTGSTMSVPTSTPVMQPLLLDYSMRLAAARIDYPNMITAIGDYLQP